MSRWRLIDVLPRVLPARWELLGTQRGGMRYRNLRDSLSLLASVDRFGPDEGGGAWYHVSVAGTGKRLPTWSQLTDVKGVWFGDVLVVQILPTRAEYVNVHEHCLHLWHRLDGPTLAGGPWG
jgi:hypothetical protein